ncbi:DUF4369 domain-containing protein [Psychroflexus sediminis]|uniref:DUF4369 domain-containing protein n=1 Tax=Psychroflexus sediminis TaxID=470826 RepID=A0A1G7ZCH7_9FLAO|nr:DUF4369 domain-containing protein [Psychroflexus sediminis]SDH05780.1 protein of unknown function [Psychroflexus sediminis]
MKYFLSLLIFTVILTSCQNKNDNLFITGDIAGLKKGSLYLQKIGDSSLVNVDSIQISGTSEFAFSTFLEEPQIMFIELDRNDGDDYAEVISFFAEPGDLALTTSLKNYSMDLKIVSEFDNQKKLEEYNEVVKRFNSQRLELIEANFNASKAQEEMKLDSLNRRFNSILKRKYLYTVNFALNNKDLEISPYVILSEAFDANIKYLDTVYNSLEKPIQKSLYGKQLKQLIEDRKENDAESVETEVIDSLPNG